MKDRPAMSGTYPETKTKAVACNFCGRVLGKEYYFTCHVCGATYCYTHMYRHAKAHRYTTAPVIE